MPANNPGFGTGYVDWGNYVNANQPGIQADRSKVQNYLGGLDTQARATQAAFDPNDPNNSNRLSANQAQQADAGTYNTLQESLQTGQQALATPGGFQQVLAAANANYNPVGDKGQANPKGPPKAAYNPFDAALEGQNAGSLYSGADTLAPAARPGPTGSSFPGAVPGQPITPATPEDQPNNIPGPGEKPKRGSALPDWKTFQGNQ